VSKPFLMQKIILMC